MKREIQNGVWKCKEGIRKYERDIIECRDQKMERIKPLMYETTSKKSVRQILRLGRKTSKGV